VVVECTQADMNDNLVALSPRMLVVVVDVALALIVVVVVYLFLDTMHLMHHLQLDMVVHSIEVDNLFPLRWSLIKLPFIEIYMNNQVQYRLYLK
jgi:hypothetical protein